MKISAQAVFPVVTFAYVCLWIASPVQVDESGVHTGFQIAILSTVASFFASAIVWNREEVRTLDKSFGETGLLGGVLVGIATAIGALLLFSLLASLHGGLSYGDVVSQYFRKIVWSLQRGYTLLVFPATFGLAGIATSYLEAKK